MSSAARRTVLLTAAAALALALGWWLRARTHVLPTSVAPMPTAADPAKPRAASAGPAIELPPAGRIAPEPRSGINAADLYKEALALWQKLTREEKKLLRNPKDAVDPAAAEALFEKIQPMIALLRRAHAEASYCDWGLGPPRFSSRGAEVTAVYHLADLNYWDAAYRFPNDPEGAIADLADHADLARSITDRGIVPYAVAVGMEMTAGDLLRDHLKILPPAALAQARTVLESLTPEADLARAMEAEAEQNDALGRLLADPKTRPEAWKAFSGMFDESATPDPAQMVSYAEWTASMERQFISHALAPDAEFNAWRSQVTSGPHAAEPFASLLPAVESLREVTQSMRTRRAMLLAALAIVEGGPDAAASVHDPNNGQPFIYHATDAGFELRSSFLREGKPLTMSFTAPPG